MSPKATPPPDALLPLSTTLLVDDATPSIFFLFSLFFMFFLISTRTGMEL